VIRAITQEARLAQEFLETLPDARVPWADRFESWAAGRALSTDLARSVRVTVLRLRMFGGAAPRRKTPR
jgi:hypothetical protein